MRQCCHFPRDGASLATLYKIIYDTAYLQAFQQASADVLCLSRRMTWPL